MHTALDGRLGQSCCVPAARCECASLDAKGGLSYISFWMQDAAQRTEGFSGRELAKLLASVQAAVYGSTNTTLTRDLWQKVVSQKLREHSQRRAFLE